MLEEYGEGRYGAGDYPAGSHPVSSEGAEYNDKTELGDTQDGSGTAPVARVSASGFSPLARMPARLRTSGARARVDHARVARGCTHERA